MQNVTFSKIWKIPIKNANHAANFKLVNVTAIQNLGLCILCENNMVHFNTPKTTNCCNTFKFSCCDLRFDNSTSWSKHTLISIVLKYKEQKDYVIANTLIELPQIFWLLLDPKVAINADLWDCIHFWTKNWFIFFEESMKNISTCFSHGMMFVIEMKLNSTHVLHERKE
jgi:hypothetical protein